MLPKSLCCQGLVRFAPACVVERFADVQLEHVEGERPAEVELEHLLEQRAALYEALGAGEAEGEGGGLPEHLPAEVKQDVPDHLRRRRPEGDRPPVLWASGLRTRLLW